MTASRFVFVYLWAAPHVLQIPIVVIMARRKVVREFPAFFAYTCFQILQFTVLFTMDQVDRFTVEHYVVGWVLEEYISVALRFAVIHEIFNHVFRSFPSLQQFGAKLFRWSTALLMVVAVLLVAYSSGTNIDRVTLPIVVVNRAVNIMQVGLLILLLLLVKYLRFSWSTYVFPMALGLGLYSSIMLANTAVRAYYGVYFEPVLMNQIEHGAYACSVLVWLVGLLLPDRVVDPVEPPPLPELEHWNAALQKLLQQ